jgi:hypothetical protein
MSVSAEVVLLVGHDKTLFVPYRVWKLLGFTSVLTKRWTLALSKFDEPYGVQSHFEKKKFVRESTLVNAKVILLIEYDKTLYTTAISVLPKRRTLTLLKIRRAFQRSVPF